MLHGNYSGTASHAVTALEGIRKQFAAAQVSYVPGTNFLRAETVIPTSALSTDDGKPGLKGEYFPANSPARRRLARMDPFVDLQLFSSGCARAPAARRYEGIFRRAGQGF